MDTAARIAKMAATAEARVDALNAQLAKDFTHLMHEVVADWSRRYPRHHFRIWEGHGMISTDINPPLGWNKATRWEEIEYCTTDDARGAIATLRAEAKAIHDAFANLDLRVQFTVVGEITSR